MTQHLWYVRRKGEVTGPFPAKQLREVFSLGQLDLGDEASLDGHAWAKLRDTDILNVEHKVVHAAEFDDEAWRQEREKAKLRWIDDAIEVAPDEGPVPATDDTTDRLRRHEAETRTLLDARSHRRPAFVAGLVAVILLLAIGYGVWTGQSGETLVRAPKLLASSSGKAVDCSLPPGERVAWSGCNKNDLVLKSANLRSADLVGTHFERSDLSGADLSYANLGSADLRGADLRNTVLKGATLRRADLTGADLSGSDLSFADLSGALMDGVRLDGASLRQSTWLDGRVCGDRSVGTCQ